MGAVGPPAAGLSRGITSDVQVGERNWVLGRGQESGPDQEATGSHRRFQNSRRRAPGEADGGSVREAAELMGFQTADGR